MALVRQRAGDTAASHEAARHEATARGTTGNVSAGQATAARCAFNGCTSGIQQLHTGPAVDQNWPANCLPGLIHRPCASADPSAARSAVLLRCCNISCRTAAVLPSGSECINHSKPRGSPLNTARGSPFSTACRSLRRCLRPAYGWGGGGAAPGMRKSDNPIAGHLERWSSG